MKKIKQELLSLDKSVDKTLASILNVIALLKSEPKDLPQLYKSGAFFGYRHLDHTLEGCLKIGLIRKEKTEQRTPRGYKREVYYLTSLGLTLSTIYDRWDAKRNVRKSRYQNRRAVYF